MKKLGVEIKHCCLCSKCKTSHKKYNPKNGHFARRGLVLRCGAHKKVSRSK